MNKINNMNQEIVKAATDITEAIDLHLNAQAKHSPDYDDTVFVTVTVYQGYQPAGTP